MQLTSSDPFLCSVRKYWWIVVLYLTVEITELACLHDFISCPLALWPWRSVCQSEKAKGRKEILWKGRDEYLMIIPNRQMFVPKQIRTNSFLLSVTALFRQWPSHAVYVPFFSLAFCSLMSYWPLHCSVFLIKLRLFSLTQQRIIFIQFYLYMRATCLGLYLGHNQACQYKNLIKEDTIKSKGTLVYSHCFFYVKNYTKYKSIGPK